MNRTYKTFLNRKTGKAVVTSELAKSHTSGGGSATTVAPDGRSESDGSGSPTSAKKVLSNSIQSRVSRVAVLVTLPMMGLAVPGTSWSQFSNPNPGYTAGTGSQQENGAPTCSGNIAIAAPGNSAFTNACNGIAIGAASRALGITFTAISQAGPVAFGASTTAAGDAAVAIGQSAYAYGDKSTALGGAATSSGGSSTALGFGASSLGSGAVAVGLSSRATTGSATAVGDASLASGSNATALGPGATASNTSSTALGYGAVASNTSSTALGTSANAGGASAVAVGDRANANADGAVAIGQQALATGGQAVSIGVANTASGNGAVAIGDPNVATGTGAVALGANNTANGQGTVALGNANSAIGLGSVALGNTSIAAAAGAVAFGASAMANNAGDVALGSGSVTSAAVGTANVTINGNTYNFAGTSTPGSTVSVGSAGSERTITNVAAGRISATSTDAVNGSELYATNQAVNTIVNGGAGIKYFHANSTLPDSQALGTNSIAVGPNAVAGNTDATAVGNGSSASAQGATALGAAATANGLFGTAVGDGSVASNVNAAAYGVASTASGIASTAIGPGAVANSVSSTALGNGSTASNVGAVALGQGAVASNVGAVALGSGSVTAAANPTSTMTVAGTAYPLAGTSPTSVVSVGAPGTERQITNVAAGRVTIGSTDAINGSQLFATDQAVNHLNTILTTITTGGGIMYFHATSTLPDSQALGTNSVAIGPNAVANNTGDVALGNGSVTAAAHATATGTVGGQTYNYAGANPSSVVSVGAPNAERQITNVAAGQVSASSTDAINGSQLFATNTAINTLSTSLSSGLSTTNSSISSLSTSLSSSIVAVKTHYYSVNDNGTQEANYNNDGATGTNSMALGPSASASGTNSSAVGNQARATASGATVMGANALGSGTNSVAVGPSSSATAANSVALGANSVANEANTVSVGSLGNERRITNVAAGVNPTDAVNVSQLGSVQSSVNEAARKAYSGVAAATALTMIPDVDLGKTIAVGIGTGSYQGYTAVAFGATARITANLKVKAGVSGSGAGGYTYGAGMSYQW